MSEVVKTLMEYNLPRDVAEKIDLEARRMHFRETREAFEKASEYALKVRIKPFGSNEPWYTPYLNKWGFATYVHNIQRELRYAELTHKEWNTPLLEVAYSNLCMLHDKEARNYVWEMDNPLKRDPTVLSKSISKRINDYIIYGYGPPKREYYLS